MQKLGLIDKAHHAVERITNVSDRVPSVLKGIRSLMYDFRKTSTQVRALVADNGSQTSDLIVRLDQTTTGFNSVVEKVDEIMSHLSDQQQQINILKIYQDLNEICSRALDLMKSHVNIASAISREIPNLSDKINYLFKGVFDRYKIVIDKFTENLDTLLELLNDSRCIAKTFGGAAVQALNETRYDVKRVSDDSQKFFEYWNCSYQYFS